MSAEFVLDLRILLTLYAMQEEGPATQLTVIVLALAKVVANLKAYRVVD